MQIHTLSHVNLMTQTQMYWLINKLVTSYSKLWYIWGLHHPLDWTLAGMVVSINYGYRTHSLHTQNKSKYRKNTLKRGGAQVSTAVPSCSHIWCSDRQCKHDGTYALPSARCKSRRQPVLKMSPYRERLIQCNLCSRPSYDCSAILLACGRT